MQKQIEKCELSQKSGLSWHLEAVLLQKNYSAKIYNLLLNIDYKFVVNLFFLYIFYPNIIFIFLDSATLSQTTLFLVHLTQILLNLDL